MTRKIRCPLDGTEQAMQAVAVAADMARRYDANLALCVVKFGRAEG